MQNIIPLHQYVNRSDSPAAKNNQQLILQLELLIQKMRSLEGQIDEMKKDKNRTISFSLQDGIVIVPTKDIVRCKAEGNYTTVHLRNNKSILVSQTLKAVEQKMGDSQFVRVHSGHLVNKSDIRKLTKNGIQNVILENGDIVPVSRSKWKSVVEVLR